MTTKRVRRTLFAFTLINSMAVTVGTTTGQAGAAAESLPAEVIVKLDPLEAATIADVTDDYDLRIVKNVLGSRGVYLVEAVPGSALADKSAKALAKKLNKDERLAYAEANLATSTSDERFHAWPDGDPAPIGTDPALWLGQPAADELALDAVHRLTDGSGVIVAVLDTGVDRTHPALRARLADSWDYVDDDADPTDVSNGIDDDQDGTTDEAFGHGSHVAGIVALVAPAATILPARVLDADGTGNVFTIAEAIHDVTAAGATVINLSFGTDEHIESKLLRDAVAEATKAGVIVVASAGNEATDVKRFPASQKGVIAVGGSDSRRLRMARFSNRGKWVGVAAPSVQIISAIPGGGYASWSGTSMAAPFVSGQVALLKSLRPDTSTKRVRESMGHTLRKLTSAEKGDPEAIDILASAIDLQ